jgi:hypothetical protein
MMGLTRWQGGISRELFDMALSRVPNLVHYQIIKGLHANDKQRARERKEPAHVCLCLALICRQNVSQSQVLLPHAL